MECRMKALMPMGRKARRQIQRGDFYLDLTLIIAHPIVLNTDIQGLILAVSALPLRLP